MDIIHDIYMLFMNVGIFGLSVWLIIYMDWK